MNKYHLYLLILLAVVLNSSCGQNVGSHKFFFIQITDPQLGFTEADGGFDAELANLEIAVDYINGKKPAFVVVTGDMVHDVHNQAQVAAYMEAMDRIDEDIPVYHVPGNHDMLPLSEETIRFYEETFGDDHFSFSCGGMRFVGINSNLIKENMEPRRSRQDTWLESELEKASDADGRMVFLHSPVFLKSFDEAEEYFNFSQADREKYWNLFTGYRVENVVAGHLHMNRDVTYDGVRMVTTGPVSVGLGDGVTGLAQWSVDDGVCSYEYITLDSIAEQKR